MLHSSISSEIITPGFNSVFLAEVAQACSSSFGWNTTHTSGNFRSFLKAFWANAMTELRN
jgi:hypothetical protein